MTERTVKVRLEAQYGQYNRETDLSAAKTGKLMDGIGKLGDKAGREFTKIGHGAEGAGDAFDSTARDATALAHRIENVTDHLEELRREFARTGDMSLRKPIASAERDLSFLTRQLKAFGDDDKGDAEDAGRKAGKALTGGLRDTLSSLPSELKGAAIVAGIGLGATMAPFLGAAVAGAVLGGVGVGGIIGGVTLASRDPRVLEAAQNMGERLMEHLTLAGAPFVEPTLAALAQLEKTADRAISTIGGDLARLAPLIKPLVSGIDKAVDALGPGISDAIDAAGPAIRVIANELPELADAISEMLSSISEESDGAVMALTEVFHIIEYGIVFTGDLVAALSAAFEWLVRTADAVSGFGEKWLGWNAAVGPQFTMLHDETQALIGDLDAAKDSSGDFTSNLKSNAEAARDAADQVKQFADAIDDLFDKTMSYDQAAIALRKGFRDLREELTDGKRTLKENSAEGDKNREAILDQIAVIERMRDATYEQTGSLEKANAVYDQNLQKLRAELIMLGYDAAAVDALIGRYRAIPTKATTTVQAPGLSAAETHARNVNRYLDELDGRIIRATILLNQETHREESRQYRRWGGITEHAATGTLRDPAIYSSVSSGARYAFAEPATGGEAFVPRRGPYGRAMGILNHAAGWYGAAVVPGAFGTRAPAPTPVIVQVNVSGGNGGELSRALMSTLRTEVSYLGGDVQNALGSRKRGR